MSALATGRFEATFKPSLILLIAIGSVFTLAWLSLWTLSLSCFWYAAFALLFIAAGWHYISLSGTLSQPRSVVRIGFIDGLWILTQLDQTRLYCRLLPGFVLTGSLVVLNFRDHKDRLVDVAVVPDMLAKEEFRQLRGLLQLHGLSGDETSD